MYGDLSPYANGGASLGGVGNSWKEIRGQYFYGDLANAFVKFSLASKREFLTTGETLTKAFGKIQKWFADLGSLAFKSTVAKSDLASDVQTSLGKADSALQAAPVSSVNKRTGAVTTTFVATVTENTATGNNEPYTCDKSFFDIVSAYQNGMTCFCAYGIALYPLTYVDLDSPIQLVGFGGLKDLKQIGIDISAADIVSVSEKAMLAADEVKMRKVTLTTAGWGSNTKRQTVAVSGVLADGTKQKVICSPVDESYDSAWNACYVQCVGHRANSLTFQCDEIPTAAVDVYVSIQPVSFAS